VEPSVVTRRGEPRLQDVCRGGRLLRCEHSGLVTRARQIVESRHRSVDREQGKIDQPTALRYLPPIAVPERVAAVDQPALAIVCVKSGVGRRAPPPALRSRPASGASRRLTTYHVSLSTCRIPRLALGTGRDEQLVADPCAPVRETRRDRRVGLAFGLRAGRSRRARARPRRRSPRTRSRRCSPPSALARQPRLQR
jgi:hypothetical protein